MRHIPLLLARIVVIVILKIKIRIRIIRKKR